MIKFFLSSDEFRLRAGWRIALFVLMFAGLVAGLSVITRGLLGGLPKTSVVILVILAVSATTAVAIARRFLDRRSLRSLGLAGGRGAWRGLLFGFALSGAMVATVFGIMLAIGALSTVEVQPLDRAMFTGLGLALLATILIGAWEELVFRGYLLRNLSDGLGLRTAVVVSCLLYGAVHASNPNATVVSTLIIVGFGYLRLAGVLYTGLLWLSMGMHIGWNFFQSAVFGYAASGHPSRVTLLSHEPAAANWVSGGQFGPEGSVIVIPVLILALLLMYRWSRWNLASAATRPQSAMPISV